MAEIENPCYHCYQGAIGECIRCEHGGKWWSGDLSAETIEADDDDLEQGGLTMAEMKIDITDAIERAIEKINAEGYTVQKWISCSERLPENRERVLVCFRSGTVHIAVWYGDYDEKGAWKVTSQFPTKLYRTDTIPKWMPMPEPPEGGADSGNG